MSLTFKQFHNALRILRSIDLSELIAYGAFPENTRDTDWVSFRDDPYGFFVRCDERTATRIWAIVEARQPMEARNEHAR